MRNYKNIKAFQLADKVVLNVYTITRGFPKEEIYGLTSQIRRASVSVTANIVEGASRQHQKDYLNFLFISKSSLSELHYLLGLSFKLGYLTEFIYIKILESVEETSKTLYGLIESVRKDFI